MSNQQNLVGTKIKKLREEFGLTQEDLAKRLNIPRPSVSQIELGKRDLTTSELTKLSKIFEISIDELLNTTKEDEKTKKVNPKSKLSAGACGPKFNKELFKEILLYILERCGARPNVGKTVIYKLLYFCDFNYYELYEEPLTSIAYRKISYGPAPCNFEKIIGEMKGEGKIKEVTTEYYGQPQIKYLPLIEPDLGKLTAQQKSVIDRVIENLSPLDAKTIADFSHEDIPVKTTKEKEIIDYELVFYRTPPYSIRAYKEE